MSSASVLHNRTLELPVNKTCPGAGGDALSAVSNARISDSYHGELCAVLGPFGACAPGSLAQPTNPRNNAETTTIAPRQLIPSAYRVPSPNLANPRLPNPEMLRLTGIQLPLNHGPEAIERAAIARLRLAPGELVSCTVFRRAHDARKNNAILLIYSLDVEVKDEAAVLKRFASDTRVRPTPDIE